jgi:hypothetical protein
MVYPLFARLGYPDSVAPAKYRLRNLVYDVFVFVCQFVSFHNILMNDV